MLTSTFTLIALSVEQTAVRAGLQALAGRLQALPDAPTLAQGRAAQLCAGLREAYDSCHWRKLEKFLVPVLRRSGAPFEALLAELDGLSRDAAVAMASARACVDAGDGGPVDRAVFRAAMERGIAALRARLDREEHALFPLARGVVGNEAWFAIANQLLAHDAYKKEKRGETPRSGTPSAPYHAHSPRFEAGLHPAALTIAH